MKAVGGMAVEEVGAEEEDGTEGRDWESVIGGGLGIGRTTEVVMSTRDGWGLDRDELFRGMRAVAWRA